jgi:hypothetical protein
MSIHVPDRRSIAGKAAKTNLIDFLDTALTARQDSDRVVSQVPVRVEQGAALWAQPTADRDRGQHRRPPVMVRASSA